MTEFDNTMSKFEKNCYTYWNKKIIDPRTMRMVQEVLSIIKDDIADHEVNGFLKCTKCGEQTPWKTLDVRKEALCSSCGIKRV